MPKLQPDRIKGLDLFIQACKELVFPAHCLACGRQLPCWKLPLFCHDCLALASFISSPVCVCCGIPFASGNDHLCGQCLAHTYSFSLARSAVLYRDPVAPLVSRLKFNKDLTGLSTLAWLAAASPGFRMLSPPDLIIPVPLHTERLRKRNYNQASLLAQAIFQEGRRKIDPILLIRNRATIAQTELSGQQRRRNLSGAFSVKRPQMVEGKKILLVDDVFTTGSTVNECARTLYKNGAERVEAFTLARVV
ncbi:MAG: ComF family protein [Desulfobulbaceae bacterium]|nr:ComF family protein [Desulfobulbaceae bacterium]